MIIKCPCCGKEEQLKSFQAGVCHFKGTEDMKTLQIELEALLEKNNKLSCKEITVSLQDAASSGILWVDH